MIDAMKPLGTALAIVCVFFFQNLQAREFTSTDGRKLNGEVLALKGDNVVLKVGTRNYTIPRDRFIEADQKYFEEWAANEAKNKVPDLEVVVSTGKSDRRDRNDSYDDRKGSFQLKVIVENEEQNFDVKGAKARLVVFGEACDDKNTFLVMQDNQFAVNVPAGKTTEWEGKKVSYEFDDNYPALWGHKYDGYALEIKNATGKIIFQKTVPTKFEKTIDKLVTLKTGQAFDKDLQNVRRGSTIYLR